MHKDATIAELIKRYQGRKQKGQAHGDALANILRLMGTNVIYVYEFMIDGDGLIMEEADGDESFSKSL